MHKSDPRISARSAIEECVRESQVTVAILLETMASTPQAKKMTGDKALRMAAKSIRDASKKQARVS